MKCLILIAVLLFSLHSAKACDCLKALTTSEAYERATFVFTGKVLKINPQYDGTGDSYLNLQVDIAIDTVFKGIRLTGKISVYTMGSTASCGFPFEEGRSYLIYSRGGRGESKVYLCDGSNLKEDAKAQIKELQQIVEEKK